MAEEKRVAKAGGIRAHAWLEDRKESTDDDGPVRAHKTDRNAPCPCGSGKKHKKCCALKEESFLSMLRGWFGF